ncbi:Glyoxalase/Bleomycin resistance protein/Dihydroxybiphenyl dioxygenase [Phaeosphaeriaceae sp. PMI808]|nr:Glyoxalase/Bleomycin resistance protein/Dihydroxybiphenyl dioxygenase [Phaeosphaeriaceae sp. PMI808]
MSTEVKKDACPVPPVGAPCWIEIMSSDPQKLKEFYTAIFPAWNFRASKGNEGVEVVHYEFEQPSGLSGGIVKLPESCGKPSEQPMGIGYTVHYFVDSIDEVGKKIVELGGVNVLPKTPERENGWFANFKDPDGNRFGVYEMNWEKHAKA